MEVQSSSHFPALTDESSCTDVPGIVVIQLSRRAIGFDDSLGASAITAPGVLLTVGFSTR
jgi:hypothetical protein